jgi:hypothetical protein
MVTSHNRNLEQHLQHRRLVILNKTQLFIPRLCRSNAKLHLIGWLVDDRVEMLLVLHFTISLHIRKMSSSNFGREAAYYEQSFAWFPSIHQAKVRTTYWIMQRLPSSCSLFTNRFILNCLRSEILQASLKESQIEIIQHRLSEIQGRCLSLR